MKRSTSTAGFTLVELLVVVAIIGVLATIGIPTFRTMVQKSKKSEAKVALGGLYTAEVAFFSEYNTFGNQIEKVGFDLDGPDSGRYYIIGFPDAACAAPPARMPDIADPVGVALDSKFPSYYTSAAVHFYGAMKVPGACEAATVPVNGATFLASASGLIAPSKAAGSVDIDGWTINEQRVLANTKDGVFY